MKKRFLAAALAAVVILIVAVLAGWWVARHPHPPLIYGSELPRTCRDQTFEGTVYAVCDVDLKAYDVRLRRLGEDGKPFGSVETFDQAMTAHDRPVLLAMNAGMYHQDLSPVGLYVENGEQQTPLNTSDGDGNFFLKPNGVFFIGKDGKAGVLETGAYAAARPDVAYATQSGPMLVIDGQLHPKFEDDGTSRFIRNGVGVRADGTVVLAISRSQVSFGSFGRLFRDVLNCPNALFLDGTVSTLSNGNKTIIGGQHPAGPILVVKAKE